MTKTKRICVTLNKEILKKYQEQLKLTLTPLSSAINALITSDLAKRGGKQ